MVARPPGAPHPTSGRGRLIVAGAVAITYALGGLPVPAAAETDTGQLTVTATVLSGCTLIGGTLDFGNYLSGQPSALDAAGQISFVNCSGTLTFELDGGQAGSTNARRMSGPEATLGYQIYKTSTRNAVWGLGADAYQLQLLGASPGSGNVTVHGRIPGGQAVPGGTYTDIVNITLTFFE